MVLHKIPKCRAFVEGHFQDEDDWCPIIDDHCFCRPTCVIVRVWNIQQQQDGQICYEIIECDSDLTE